MKTLLPSLRTSLLRCLLALLAAGIVVALIHRFGAVAAEQYELEVARSETLRAGHATDEPALALAGRAFYVELLSRGAVSPDAPPDWAERLADLQERYRMASVEYELGPARKDGALSGPGTHAFMAQPMTLRLGVRQEQQLLDFLDELVASMPAVARVSACRLAKVPDSERSPDFRLAATCVVDWLTLRRTA